MGLHLGWIPNDPGLRPRQFERAVPAPPEADPAKVAALKAAQQIKGIWARLLIAVGLFPLVFFGLVATLSHRTWFWGIAGGLALLCWWPVVRLFVGRRRAAARLREHTARQTEQHVAEIAAYQDEKARWDQAEVDRVAIAPRWLQVAAHEDISRLDVFGGTVPGRQGMLTGLGWELLRQRAVIVLDLSQDRVADGLLSAAVQGRISCQDYELPRDLGATPLLAGLTGDEIASLIVEVVHADDVAATAAGRATDLMILKKVNRVLGDDVSLGRLHAALALLLGDAPQGPAAPGVADSGSAGPGVAGPGPVAPGSASPGAGDLDGSGPDGSRLDGSDPDWSGLDDGVLGADERAALAGQFGTGLRAQVAGNLLRLAAVLEPIAGLGADGPLARPPARLTCLSLADGPRDVTADLVAALIVQWITRAVAADDGFAPAVILAGADEQSTRHLGRLTAVCERYEVPLVRVFSRLTEESARHLDTRHTAFMRLATRPEALRAAEHIGLERRFVAGRFAHRHSVSRSRTRTTSDSVTHTTGRTEGEATTHTTGTTTGQAYSEARVPRHEQNITIENHNHVNGGGGGRDAGGRREAGDSAGGSASGQSRGGAAAGNGTSRGGDSGQDRAVRDAAENGTGVKNGRGVRDAAEGRTADPRPRDRAGSGWGSGRGGSGSGGSGSGGSGSGGSGSGGKRSPGGSGKPQIDIVKTRTWFTAQHESEANTKSWSTTEETSHTTSNSRSRTDGVEVGDEISYELVYDHKVHPETLMALPEDQMLAPHIVEGAAAGAGKQVPDGKIIALVVDPGVVGSAAVAPVRPDEIPAFEPPPPAVSGQVPDYDQVPRKPLDGVSEKNGL